MPAAWGNFSANLECIVTSAVSPAADPVALLYGQHHQWLLRWLRGKLSCTDHAADLAQDTFVKLLATLAQLSAPTVPSVEDRLLILETLHQIDAMLDGLGAKVRTAFLLSQLEGLAYADIAARLNVSERTVKRYMVQAFEQCILLLA